MIAELPLPSQVLNQPFILNNSTQHDSDKNNTEVSTTFWTHCYSVAGLGLLLPEGSVGEVFDKLPLCRLPNTSDWLNGMASQRGNVVPIFDLVKILGLDKNAEKVKRKYFLIGQREKTIGILIDEMPSRIFLDRKDRLAITPPLPAILQPFVHACYQVEQRVWIDWDVDAFFLAVGDRI
ncbi:MAG: chemotaxis protein CheW [Gammaproteobacteria bacterium]